MAFKYYLINLKLDTIFKKEIKTSLSHREALRQCFYLVGYNYYQLCQPLELH